MSKASKLPTNIKLFKSGLFKLICDKIKEANSDYEGINDIQWKDFKFKVYSNINVNGQGNQSSRIVMTLNKDDSRVNVGRYRDPDTEVVFNFPNLYINDLLDNNQFNQEFDYSLYSEFENKFVNNISNSGYVAKKVEIDENEIRYYIQPKSDNGSNEMVTEGIVYYKYDTNYNADYDYSGDEDRTASWSGSKDTSSLISIKYNDISKPDSLLSGSLDDMKGYEIVFKRDAIREEDKINIPTPSTRDINFGNDDVMAPTVTEVYASL